MDVEKEKVCIGDLIKYIEMHTQEGRYDLAQARVNDIVKSLNELQKYEALKAVKRYEKVG